MRKFFLLLIPFCMFSLEKQPWFGNVYELQFLSSYTYSRYSSVDGAIVPLKDPSNDHLVYLGLEVPFSQKWNIDGDLQFSATPRQDFGFRSFALQCRKLILDDITGDPLSFTLGAYLRYTSDKSLKDISCPSRGKLDFEAKFALGKEFDYFEDWFFRIWLNGGLGIANKGSIWIDGTLGLESHLCKRHILSFFLLANHGYGKKDYIDINNFKGYGEIRNRSIDIAFRYGYQIGVWGMIRFEYARKVLSKLGPEDVDYYTLSYLLPFSF